MDSITDEVDYKTLLIKYMNHVGEYEGTTFLGDHMRDHRVISDREWSILQNEISPASERLNGMVNKYTRYPCPDTSLHDPHDWWKVNRYSPTKEVKYYWCEGSQNV